MLFDGGVSSVTRKSKTLTLGGGGTAGGGAGASGGGATMEMVLPVSGSGASSTYAFGGACQSVAGGWGDFLDFFSLYNGPSVFWASVMQDY